MKFFFPDSLDLVDPSFNFETEHRSITRVRQRDDLYAHEVFPHAPYDGLLVSKSIVEGTDTYPPKYTLSQRLRFRREGVHEFLRAVNRTHRRLEVIGDCGAYNYVEKQVPPCSVEDVLCFYEEAGFDYGISVDHVIPDYEPIWDITRAVPERCRFRQELTLELAAEFFSIHRSAGLRFEPIAVAQGWSPISYAAAVSELQKVGYRYVALGGMAHLKTKDILTCLQTVHQVRHSSTKLHLLGVTRINELASYDSWGVASIDSTSPLKMAFKDSKNNYFTSDRAYSAIRIPQVEGNADLLKEIQGGRVSQELALKLEKRCLQAMADFDAGRCSADDVASVIAEFERLFNPKSNRQQVYRDVLEERPWKQCPCQICRDIGYHVILFRGSERNKRRAFHNLEVFYQRLQRLLIGIDELKAAV